MKSYVIDRRVIVGFNSCISYRKCKINCEVMVCELFCAALWLRNDPLITLEYQHYPNHDQN